MTHLTVMAHYSHQQLSRKTLRLMRKPQVQGVTVSVSVKKAGHPIYYLVIILIVN